MTGKQRKIEAIIESFGKLQLDQLDEAWVNEVWDSEFVDKSSLPVQYEETLMGIDCLQLIDRLSCLCREYLQLLNSVDETRGNSPERSLVLVQKSCWSELVERQVKQRGLIALISYYVMHDSDSADYIKLSLAFAGLYIALISLPGSGPYKIFHPNVYHNSLKTFKIVKTISMLNPNSKRKKNCMSQGPSQDRKRQRLTQGCSQPQSSEAESEELQEEDQHEISELVTKMAATLHDMLLSSSLKKSPESLELTVETLISLIQLETTLELDMSKNGYRQPTQKLVLRCLKCLQELCSELHGNVKRSTALLLLGLVPRILMIPDEAYNINTKGLYIIKENCVTLVKSLFHKFNTTTPGLMDELILTLAQHLADRVPDKIDYRQYAASTIRDFLELIDTNHYSSALRWFLGYCMSNRISSRVMGLEVLGALLSPNHIEDGTPQQIELHEEHQNIIKKFSKLIFAIIYQRTNDVSNKVTTQALKVLGDITSNQSDAIKQLLSVVRANTSESREALDWNRIIDTGPDRISDDELAALNPLPLWSHLLEHIHHKVKDISVNVRKSGLIVTENILRNSGDISGDLLAILVRYCRDPSVAIRKQMIATLKDLLLDHPNNIEVVEAWAQGSLPLVKDVESTAEDKACQAIYECLMDNLVASNRRTTSLHQLPWLIVKAVDKMKLELYLLSAVKKWATEKRVTKQHIISVKSYLEDDLSTEAWMFLGILTSFVPCTEPKFVLNHFDACLTLETIPLNKLLNVTKVLFTSVGHLSIEDRDNLCSRLLDLIGNFQLPVEVISIAVDICTVICKSKHEPAQANRSTESWTTEIIKKIEVFLDDQILSIPSHTRSEKTLSRYIFTLGELAQIAYNKLDKKLYLLLQSVVFFQDEGDEDNVECPQIFSQQFQCRFKPSMKLRALAVGTLGKMCLQKEDYAKKIIPVYGQILDQTNDAPMKNNIMYVLSDMCVRYASLIDPLKAQMIACLKDESLVVRKTTLILLIHLLQEDYLKIRGKSKFFLYFLHTLLDPSREVKDQSQFYIEQRLLKRNANIMCSSFVEAIFHYNNYVGHERFNKFDLSDKERNCFSLEGTANRDKRFVIYSYMLQNMRADEKLKCSAYLNNEVLQGISEKKIVLDRATELLKDTFRCLCSEEIKISRKSERPEQVDNVENEQAEQVLQNVVLQHVYNTQWEKTLGEIIIPTILELKNFLEKKMSPFLEDLIFYLKKMMEDNASEVSNFLSADPQLAKEIEYEIKKADEKEARRKAEEEAVKQRQLARASSLTALRGDGTVESTSSPRLMAQGIVNSPRPRSSTNPGVVTPVAIAGRHRSTPTVGAALGSAKRPPTTRNVNLTAGRDLVRRSAAVGAAAESEAGMTTPSRLLQERRRSKVLQHYLNGTSDREASPALANGSNPTPNMNTSRRNSRHLDTSQICSSADPTSSITRLANKTTPSIGEKVSPKKAIDDKNTDGTKSTAANSADYVELSEKSSCNDESIAYTPTKRKSPEEAPSNKQSPTKKTKRHSPVKAPNNRKSTETSKSVEQSPAQSDRFSTRKSPSPEKAPSNRKSNVASPSVEQSPAQSDRFSTRKSPLPGKAPSNRKSNEASPSVEQSPAQSDRISTGKSQSPGKAPEKRQSLGMTQTEKHSPVKVLANGESCEEPPASSMPPPSSASQTDAGERAAQGGSDSTAPTTSSEFEGSADSESELNKSKRISGQGMPRAVKTPISRKLHQLRAVSTPQVNKTIVSQNLTFTNETLELSSITVLSPQSTLSNNGSEAADTSSFRFNLRTKDRFDAIAEPATARRKSGRVNNDK